MQWLALGDIANRSAHPQAEISELFADRLPATTPYHVIPGEGGIGPGADAPRT